jgi:hypothetical protein
MKRLEQDYKLSDVEKAYRNELGDNKELKAKKASLLSVKNLKLLAQKHNLKEPDEKHILVVPK